MKCSSKSDIHLCQLFCEWFMTSSFLEGSKYSKHLARLYGTWLESVVLEFNILTSP
jgi:hypothetical protein